MSGDVETIAAGLHDANVRGYIEGREYVYELLLEYVQVHRIPPWPDDGDQWKEDWVGYGRTEIAAFREAMPDFHQEDVETSMDGNDVTLWRTICGTMRDGRELRVRLHNVYSVEDGRITRIGVDLDPDAVVRIKDALQSGGLSQDTVESFVTFEQ